MAANWSLDSWRGKAIRQMPDYPDQAVLTGVEDALGNYPPLVFAGEARRLKTDLA